MHLFRSDRRALPLLFAIVIAAWAGIAIERWLLHPSRELPDLDELAMDSLSEHELGTPSNGLYSHNKENENIEQSAPKPTHGKHIETFAFDPNTADSTTLLRLGLTPWQVKSILKYRSMGGRYHRTEDFKRVPGMTPEVFERLEPVIHIGRAFRYYDDMESSTSEGHSQTHNTQSQRLRDSIATLPRVEKFREVTTVDLNTADTLLLQRIPGIASYRSRQIIRYRERLGGFTSVGQLAEIEGFPANELAAWFKVEQGVFRHINVNKATIAEMGKHPYMGFTRARAIDNYRHKHGPLHDLSELRLLPDFTEDAINRLRPYVEY